MMSENKIKICENPYSGKDYQIFQNYPFQLDDFQKYAIQAIEEKENVLVMAGTGSGKTLCAEHAIEKSLQLGKKVIYTSPIKSLSNQKFNEFNRKWPGDRVGILTGDIKFNPDGQILIMTTEILRNLLYHNEIKLDPITGASLRLNIKEEVFSVIFDEVHYINDPDRGKVWEESLILLPKCVNLVLLSATISGAESFGQWLQDIKEVPLNLTGNKKRVIPLKHSYYLSIKSLNNQGLRLTNDERFLLEKYTHKLVPILENETDFYQENIDILNKIIRKHEQLINREGSIDNLLTYLIEKQMCPAIFFIFSRKRCEKYARKINKIFNTSQEQAEVERIIKQQLHKLDNPENYLQMREFINLKQLLIKGIAYHHSGLVPVFKEIIEILFAKNLIKVLMATETFAVGINMPTKTVVFTALDKYESYNNNRWLRTDEYLQMAGRAGRRGMDKVGYVIFLPNLGDVPQVTELREMMMGKPRSVRSKFTLNYQFLLKVILNESVNLRKIIENSLWNQEMTSQLKYLRNELAKYSDSEFDLSKYKKCFEYQKLLETSLPGTDIKLSQNVIKKNKQKAQKMLSEDFRIEYSKFKKIKIKLNEKKEIEDQIFGIENEIEDSLRRIFDFLSKFGYIEGDYYSEPYNISQNMVTMKGIMASQVNQCQELLLAEIVYQGVLNELNSKELAGFLAIFSDYKNNDKFNPDIPKTKREFSWNIQFAYDKAKSIANKFWDGEETFKIYLSNCWEINFDFTLIAYDWACFNGELKSFNLDGMFAGEFIKEMIKISHLAEEVAILAGIMGNNQLKLVAEQVPILVIKDIVGVDSLYIKNT